MCGQLEVGRSGRVIPLLFAVAAFESILHALPPVLERLGDLVNDAWPIIGWCTGW